MDELCQIEMHEVQSRWAQSGNPALGGLGDATWWQKPGDFLTFGYSKPIREWIYGADPKSQQELQIEYAKGEKQAQESRIKYSIPEPSIRTPPILPEPPKSPDEESAKDEAKTEDSVVEDAQAEAGEYLRLGDRDFVEMQQRPPWAVTNAPWLVVGGLGLIVLVQVLRR